MQDNSLSISLSRAELFENDSMYRAYEEDAENRTAEGARPEAISNEEIGRGNVFLETYTVVSDAIHGGMGSVWKVHHEGWGTDLAMKRPQPRYFTEGSADRKKEFISECEHWISLGIHPNIVSCYYVREIGGVPTIFAEWMDGGSLKDAIQSGALYEGTEERIQARILDIAVQAARGLKYSHAYGLIHRDVKPGNILLTGNGEAKVADFGLAKAQQQAAEDGQGKSVSGTVQYCPKEQAEGAEAGAWMDAYAWALTVLEMYAGRRLWQTGAEVRDTFDDCVRQCAHAVPEKAAALLRGCLQPDHTENPEIFGTLAEKLEAVYAEVTGRDYPRPEADFEFTAADNLNNYAMSMLDLGNPEAAKAAWDQAARDYPNHVLSAANRAFFLWRRAEITDTDAELILRNLPDSPEKEAAKALYRQERGESAETESGPLEQVLRFHGVRGAVFDGSGRLWVFGERTTEIHDPATGKKLQEFHGSADLVTPDRARDRIYTLSGGTMHNVHAYDAKTMRMIGSVSLDPCDEGKFRLYPETERTADGLKYTLNRKTKTKWEDIRTEENGTVLRVLETSTWDNAEDRQKYEKWEKARNSLFKFTAAKTAPVIRTRNFSYFLRFRIEDEFRLTLREAKAADNGREEPEEAHGGRYIAVTDGKKKTPGCRLTEQATGRVVRTLIYGGFSKPRFSPDGEYYFANNGGNLTCCRVPAGVSDRQLYTLSRYKETQILLEEENRSAALQKEFSGAMLQKDYGRAIRAFEEFRGIPDNTDSKDAIRMELALSRVCRKKRLHHTSTPVTDMPELDTEVFDPGWTRIDYTYEEQTGKLRSGPTARIGLQHTGSEQTVQAVMKALELLRSGLPVRYRNGQGEEKAIAYDGTLITFPLMNYAATVLYATMRNGNGDSDFATLRVDLAARRIETAALRKGTPAPAPDGKRLAMAASHRWDEKRGGRLSFFDNEVTGYEADVPSHISAVFSPDSDFVLCHSLREERIVSVRPENPAEEEPRKVYQAELPKMPASKTGSVNRQVFFSRDGMHLLIFEPERNGEAQKKAPLTVSGAQALHELIFNPPEETWKGTPWLRLSWEYEETGR